MDYTILILLAMYVALAQSARVRPLTGTASSCSQLERTFPEIQRVKLLPPQLDDLLKSFQGDVLHGYMANNLEDAKTRFKGLICENDDCSSPLHKRVKEYQSAANTVEEKSRPSAPSRPRYHPRRNRSSGTDATDAHRHAHVQTCSGTKVPPEDIGIPAEDIVSVDPATGAVTALDCCEQDGNEIPPFHRRLCTVCDATTSFPAGDYWPEFLNEATCAGNDQNQCLMLDEVWQGTCSESVASLQLLHRVVDSCMLVELEGDLVITDDWEVLFWGWKTGCQCSIIRGSPLDEQLMYSYEPDVI